MSIIYRSVKGSELSADEVDGNFQFLLETKQDSLTFDSIPTYGSSNPVTSDGIYNAIVAALVTDALKLDGSNGPMTGNVDWGGFEINNIELIGAAAGSMSFAPSLMQLDATDYLYVTAGQDISITSTTGAQLQGGGSYMSINDNNVYVLSHKSGTNRYALDLNAYNTWAKFYDYNASPAGLQYGADYSSTYTSRSLIDRGSADARYATLPALTNNSVVFWNGGFAEDNTNFYWNDTANALRVSEAWMGTNYFTGGGSFCLRLGSEALVQGNESAALGTYQRRTIAGTGIYENWIIGGVVRGAWGLLTDYRFEINTDGGYRFLIGGVDQMRIMSGSSVDFWVPAKYNADYSGSYTDRTLIDRGSADVRYFKPSYSAITTATAVTTEEFVDCTTGTFAVTLPTAVGYTKPLIIFNSGTGVITINTTSSQTISGQASGVITLIQYAFIELRSNGTNWYKTN